MASVNKVILVGNLGKEPEVRFMPNGEAVCNFSIATTDNWKDKNGEKQSKTEWHNIVIYRKLAEIAGEYLKKGSPVYIEGSLQTRKWQTKEGDDRYTTEIIANSMQMLGTKGGSSSAGDSSNQSTSRNEPKYDKENYTPPPAGTKFDDFEDDIPFN
jgi:single-strand DNA-binding protein